MKVAILSVSLVDKVAVHILVEKLLGIKTASVQHEGLHARGWPSVRSVFPTVIKQLHYRSDAAGLVLVVDSNNSPIHEQAHELSHCHSPKCRLSELRKTRDDVSAQLKPRVVLPKLKIATAVAVLTIEARLVYGIEPDVNETA